jgi:hypothetical protein
MARTPTSEPLLDLRFRLRLPGCIWVETSTSPPSVPQKHCGKETCATNIVELIRSHRDNKESSLGPCGENGYMEKSFELQEKGDAPMTTKIPCTPKYTTKQMGDACEMLVAAELTLAGIPAQKAADNWRGYDVFAQPPGNCKPLRISVKSRTFKRGSTHIGYCVTDHFDWLALVILPETGDGRTRRKIFVIPRKVADQKARRNGRKTKSANGRYWSVSEVAKVFAAFEGNFSLQPLLRLTLRAGTPQPRMVPRRTVSNQRKADHASRGF